MSGARIDAGGAPGGRRAARAASRRGAEPPFAAFGRLLLRPALDRVLLGSVARWLCPLSRGWAAALASQGDVERFSMELGRKLEPGWALAPVLRRVEELRLDFERAAADWDRLFFAPEVPAQRRLLRAEQRRSQAAERLQLSRALFLRWRSRLPPVRWEIAAPEAVEAAYCARLDGSEPAFPAPGLVPVAVSHDLVEDDSRIRWLRFASPFDGSTAWARVYEPAAGTPAGSLVFLHGIGVETEMMRGRGRAVRALVGQGLRVVLMEGPWHGRRRLPGRYAGEPIIGRGPMGLIELFQAWVSEVAVVTRWLRTRPEGEDGAAPVALGGVSLGALASQMAASAAARWPEALRPDGLLLVTTSGSMMTVALEGSLTRAVGLPAALERAGWHRAALDRWRPLLEPGERPGLDPGRIVVVLGEADDLTPYAGGARLAGRWAVPPENLILRPQGHFTVALDLFLDPTPFHRLAEVMGR